MEQPAGKAAPSMLKGYILSIVFFIGNKIPILLRIYFRSGWSFLIPYLSTYLLYAWLDWPVNAGGTGVSEEGSMESGAGIEPASLSPSPLFFLSPPALLHVYWALHALHLALGAVVLATLWRGRSGSNVAGIRSKNDNQESADHPNYSTGLHSSISDLPPPVFLPATRYSLLATLPKAAPWLLLGLLFYIPGLYLEWPSDPWEHLRRINEWHAHSAAMDHSSWKKSSYFLPYSLTVHTTGLSQLRWLNCYYTGICLLLCWQYHRLAQAVGLGERGSMIFVILQALLMGNNVFSFYRYYGLSSTIFAQLGAIALTRIALEALSASSEGREKKGKWQRIYPPPATHYPLLRSAAAALALLPLIGFSHLQGLGIAGLGVMAAIVWRLIEWRRSMSAWLALGAMLLSIAVVLWFPLHPALDEAYRPQGWLTAWHGFNLFSPSSSAFERALHIFGAFGVLNLTVGLWLILRKNHPAGWLTFMPVLVLTLPCFALPFAHVVVTEKSVDDILTFHRMLLAVPVGLALTSLAADSHRRSWCCPPNVGLGLLVAVSAILVMLSPSHPWWNRLYHLVALTPADLALKHVAESPQVSALLKERPAAMLMPDPNPVYQGKGAIIAPAGLIFATNALGGTLQTQTQRSLNWPLLAPPALTAATILDNLQYVDSSAAQTFNFSSTPLLVSPSSTSGFLSQHWQPQEVALVHATQRELSEYRLGPPLYHKRPPQIWLEWTRPDDPSSLPQGDPGPLLEGNSIDDRGRIILPSTLRAGDSLSLRALMRTSDGDGWRLSLSVRGPVEQEAWSFSGIPNPLGGALYVSGDRTVELVSPGEYLIDLTGALLWPVRYRTVRYHLTVLPSEMHR